MLEMKIKAEGRRYVYPAELRHRLGPDRARQELGTIVDFLILQLDMIDGDPDFENDTSDVELSGDEMGDPAYAEWHTLRGPERKRGSLLASMHEDDEDCDPLEEDDPAEEDDESGQCDEDGINTNLHAECAPGAGCTISDDDSDWQNACPLALNDN